MDCIITSDRNRQVCGCVAPLRHRSKLTTFLVALKLFIWSSTFCERETASGENDRPAVPNRCQDSPHMLLTSNANFSHYCYFGFGVTNQKFSKWTFWHEGCAHGNVAKFEYLHCCLTAKSSTQTQWFMPHGLLWNRDLTQPLKSIGIFESAWWTFWNQYAK